MAARIPRRKPRAMCPMGFAGIQCHAYGREADCTLCGMINWDHPTTAASARREPPEIIYDRAEREVVAQLDRVMRAGWVPQPGTQLDGVAKDHGLYEARMRRMIDNRRAREAAEEPPPF